MMKNKIIRVGLAIVLVACNCWTAKAEETTPVTPAFIQQFLQTLGVESLESTVEQALVVTTDEEEDEVMADPGCADTLEEFPVCEE